MVTFRYQLPFIGRGANNDDFMARNVWTRRKYKGSEKDIVNKGVDSQDTFSSRLGKNAK